MTNRSWRSPKVRRPREAVQRFVDQLIGEMPSGIEFHLLGSWRREAPEIGDLDVLIVTPSGELQALLRPTRVFSDSTT